MCKQTILLIEAYYGGSHKQLIDLIYKELGNKASLYTLPAKKWHWRARTSALYFANTIPVQHSFRILFTTSVLNLTDFVALRPDISKLHKIVYFHENQMIYPVRERKDRDFQYGYNEVMTSLVADKIIFNSHFNQESYLKSIKSFFKIMPDYRPKGLEEKIRPKCSVLYYPIQLPSSILSKLKPLDCNQKLINTDLCETNNEDVLSNCEKQISELNCDSTQFSFQSEYDCNETVVCEKDFLHLPHEERSSEQALHIVWPHRWEHDKGPEEFFSVMFRLKDENLPFKLSVLGESYAEKPDIFHQAKEYLKENIIHWNYQYCKQDYFDILCSADVVVSTAKHEFFGVAMLEAVSCACYPLCPHRLVYPEIFSDDYLFNTTNQLYKKLKNFCKRPYLVRKHSIEVNIKRFMWETLKKEYMTLFEDR